jgi:hypothetical protein
VQNWHDVVVIVVVVVDSSAGLGSLVRSVSALTGLATGSHLGGTLPSLDFVGCSDFSWFARLFSGVKVKNFISSSLAVR